MQDPQAQPAIVKDRLEKSRFEIAIDGHRAVAIYEMAPGVITFVHTLVADELQGRGLARQLVLAGLASARERGLAVIPRCPVFAAYMRAHPETHDLLAPEGRALLGL
ncbi:GNAT family N-acetyltransferase [Variovorax sp. LT1R16]|uniref:GNAT family N-acetyltransferase n=1 Tax=Variovorax sp. LT1R16 TaxID=3443728 RepID=UPI003F449E79